MTISRRQLLESLAVAGATALGHRQPVAASTDTAGSQEPPRRRSSAVEQMQAVAIDERVEPILVFLPRRD